MTKVVSVIVTFNGSKWIERCLECLQASSINHRIIVVDNKSSDATADLIAKDFPEVELIINPANYGFGKANNIGIKAALSYQPDYIFIVNQDVYVEPSSLESLVSIGNQSDKYGIISPVHASSDGKTLDHGFKLHMEKANVDMSKVGTHQPSQELFHVDFVNAAAWLVPLHVLKEVGGFDPIFTHYGEDDQLASRIRYHGYKIVVYNGARIIHDRRQAENRSQFDLQVEYRNYLARATDLQNDFRPEYIRTIKKWGKDFLKASKRFRIGVMLTIVRAVAVATFNKGVIRRTRKITLQPPYPYLYIDVR